MSYKTRICLLTSAQPTTDPRLTKEADALTEAGYEVHVFGAYCGDWAMKADRLLLATRAWSCTYVGGGPGCGRVRYGWTRLRNGLSRRFASRVGDAGLLGSLAFNRVLPELKKAAKSKPADLYIAHNIEALPAAVLAAKKHGARAGFDAEDLHSGMQDYQVPPFDRLVEQVEREYLPACDYVTAASPGTAAAYALKYGIPEPTTILNVFPLCQRPDLFKGSPHHGPLKLYWCSQTIGDDEGLEDVVRAMGTLPDCDIQLHLRGQWQRGYRQRLLRLAESLGGLSDRIVSKGPAPPEELVRLAAEYDVGLVLQQPVDENTNVCLTNKLFMHILAGNAIAATNTEAQQLILKRLGGAGFLHDPGDVEELARGLRRWCEDRKSLNYARRQTWDWGTRKYNWDVEKQLFLGTIDGVLTGRGKAQIPGVYEASHNHRP